MFPSCCSLGIFSPQEESFSLLFSQSEVSSLFKVKVWLEKSERSTEHGMFDLGHLSAKRILRNQMPIPDQEMRLANRNEN